MQEYGPLYVVGLGPGNMNLVSPLALTALNSVACIAGYSLYLGLLPKELKAGKTIIETGMRHERERCEKAIAAATSGTPTAIVCSGDPGIYAMASLVMELLERDNLLARMRLEIIPGVPALCAAAARLGAPLAHDFACISLSDLLTPWELIEKRIHCALEGDFVCVIYNPRSHGRPDYLARVLEMTRARRGAGCPVAVARNIARSGETVAICRAGAFDCATVDMLSLVIIGNSQTRIAGGYMLTPRGYALHDK